VKPFAPALPSHIPSLDGLRALSILLVLTAHLDGTSGFPFHTGMLPGDIGNLGVRIFFVISGFLITTLLLKEFDRTGTISLRNFYAKRTLRIFPAFYAFGLVIALLSATGRIRLLPGDLLHAFTYTMNYHFPHGWYMAHIWSLSVEEQFYLLWPFTMLVVRPRRALWFSFAAILLPPLFRVATLLWFPAMADAAGEQFHAVSDAIASGCLLAIIYNMLGASDRYRRFLQSWWFLLVPTIGLVVFLASRSTRFYFGFGITILNSSIALCLDRLVRYPVALLNWPPLRFLGLLSYSLYLWQQPFLNRHSSSPAAAFPLNLLLVMSCALGSYYLIERPIREYGYRKLNRRRAAAGGQGNVSAAE
jgi:peptidoglycan/LPS O-acetylase OafA/YrhL